MTGFYLGNKGIDDKEMYWINKWKQGERILPTRGGNPWMGRRIECKILLELGKPGFRELCKGDQIYKLNIELDNKNISGKSDNGNIIPINNIGRWLFGVPGYGGNAIFNEYDGFVYLSNETPEIVDEMIKRKCKEYAIGRVRNAISENYPIENKIKQLTDEGRDEDCLHAYLMGMLDGLYYDEKRITKEEYEEGKKLIAMIPPTKLEKEYPILMDYELYSK